MNKAEICEILARVYGLTIRQLEFLNLGADMDAAVYRAIGTGGKLSPGEDETVWFVKLKRGPFNPITATLPCFLRNNGVAAIIPPLPTQSDTFNRALFG